MSSPHLVPDAHADEAIGILGGTGLYDLAGMQDLRPTPVSTPFGDPSDVPMVGQLGGRRVVFLPRHGRGHRYLPSEIPYRANVHAMKQLGVGRLLSVSAVGSLREDVVPGDVVLVDQLMDRTHRRTSTFFGDGCAGHVSFAEPVCVDLGHQVARGARQAGLGVVPLSGIEGRRGAGSPRALHVGGTYVCMEGPQFSTRAESLHHRSLGAAVIGMTGVTEAKLAREAELCFSLLALVTDYDCWHPEEESVTASALMEILRDSVAGAREILRCTLIDLTGTRTCRCARAAEHAILTSREAIPAGTRERLRLLYGRYIT